MRVAIFGIGGLYNFGCEAIVRGTVDFVRKSYGDETIITYYSRDYLQDKKAITDLGIEIEEIHYKPSLYKKVISKVIDILRVPVVPFYKKIFLKIIDNSDLIISVGGDIYTIPRYLREKEKYRYVNYMVEFGKIALRKNKRVIIYGASIGPFGQYKKAKSYYIDHLKSVEKIICREMESVSYLRDVGVTENVLFLPDPAFLVRGNISVASGNYIGVNLSELSIQEVYGKVSVNMVNDICRILEGLVEKTGYSLMLIPHVLSPYTKEDNDQLFLKEIYESLSEEIREKVLLTVPESFIDAKKYLRQCKIVVAARMHCAINSIIEGTPAIFLSYSQKSIGMSKFVYGNTKYTIDMKDINTHLMQSVIDLLEEYDQVKKSIESCNEEIRKYYDEYYISQEEK